mmetsp:Transcript_24626/g.49003  ORF Transcript_24626/g.49003 Transcript_24626/m.49003 type:complete len:298 (-) Transcript_24626:211-1104(-)
MVRNSNANHGSLFSAQSRQTTRGRAESKGRSIIRNVNKTANNSSNRTPVRTYGKSDIYQARSCSPVMGKSSGRSTKPAARFSSSALKSEALKTSASTENSSFSSLRSSVSKDSSKGRLSRANTANSQSSSKRSRSVDGGSSMRRGNSLRSNHERKQSYQSKFLTGNFAAGQMESNCSIRATMRNRSNSVSNWEEEDAANDQNNEEEYEYGSEEQRLMKIRDYTVKSAANIGKATVDFTKGACLGLGKRVEDVIEDGLSALLGSERIYSWDGDDNEQNHSERSRRAQNLPTMYWDEYE